LQDQGHQIKEEPINKNSLTGVKKVITEYRNGNPSKDSLLLLTEVDLN